MPIGLIAGFKPVTGSLESEFLTIVAVGMGALIAIYVSHKLRRDLSLSTFDADQQEL